ncbi:MAG: NAD-dependent epimerase/dehydratase family protein [Opitutaceae bacterium]
MSHSLPAPGKLIIFGCGYLGRALAVRARELGLTVTVVTRNPGTAADLRKLDVSVVEGRLQDDSWHGDVPASPEYVVNCVGSADRTDEGYRQSYLEGMASILEWAKGGAPGVFVYTSSTGVYGRADGMVDEATVPEPDSERSRILFQTEELARESSAFDRWFILRLAGLYGPERHQLLDRVLAGQTIGADEPDRPLNIIHRDDAVEAILACLGAPAAIPSQVFNLSGGEPVSRREMMEWIEKRCRELGLKVDLSVHVSEPRPSRVREIPDRIVSARRIGEVAGWRPRYPDFRSGYEAILGRGFP